MFCSMDINDSSYRHPDWSREIYPRVAIDELDAAGRALRDAILSGPRSTAAGQFPIVASDGTLEGPFGAFLFSPAVGAPLEALGVALRTSGVLAARHRELAILAVALELGSDFELRAHLPLARSAGVTAAEIETLAERRSLPDPCEAALVEFCRANAVHSTPAAEFDMLRSHFDRAAVFEVTALVMYYRGLATMLELFAIRPLPV